MEISFDPQIVAVAPQLRVVTFEADVVNGDTPDELWGLIEAEGVRIRSTLQMADINKRPGIAATRSAYKALGKEPNRYRPSAEAMCRRIVKENGLYRLTTLVDLINLVSIRSGYSIGGFDADRVSGDMLTLGVGREGEEFEAIGRGQLNIACLPVYRDDIGGIGTPTSDHMRTRLTHDTRRLLMTVNIYGEEMPVGDLVGLVDRLLRTFAGARNIIIRKHQPYETAQDISVEHQ